MKKIEVKKYDHCEYIVIVYELDKRYIDTEDVDYDNICVWDKVDLFDPRLKYNSGVNVGYRGEGPRTLARIIVETFRDYENNKAQFAAIENVEEYLSKIGKEKDDAIDNFTIIEKDINHLL